MSSSTSDAFRMKQIQEYIGNVEQHYTKIHRSVLVYMQTLAKLRDRGEDVATAISAYSDSETNLSMKSALKEFAENLFIIEDYRTAQIIRIETKVLESLEKGAVNCRQSKDRVKKLFSVAGTKGAKGKVPHDKSTHKLSSDKEQSTPSEAVKANRELQEAMDLFEKKKLHDIKTLISDAVHIELAFFSKALEMHTLCYKSVAMINDDQDFQQFGNTLQPFAKPSAPTEKSIVPDVNFNASNVERRWQIYSKEGEVAERLPKCCPSLIPNARSSHECSSKDDVKMDVKAKETNDDPSN